MKQRKGFTLIELMIVVAIIIILAAVAIPNYLNMTTRAKKSRVAADFDTLATALEAYNTDWGHYPTSATALTFGHDEDFPELSGVGDVGATLLNAEDNSTVTGEEGPFTYIKQATIQGMVNPFDSTKGYGYVSDANGTTWTLFCDEGGTKWLVRTDSKSAVEETTSNPSAEPEEP